MKKIKKIQQLAQGNAEKTYTRQQLLEIALAFTNTEKFKKTDHPLTEFLEFLKQYE